jgi:hypothetical protein
MKRCFRCGNEKPLSEFYKHPRMADGHLGKCKTCTKQDVKTRYYAKFECVKAYERVRFQSLERKRKIRIYARLSRQKNPQKWKARDAVHWAVKTGKLVRPDRCSHCQAIGPVQAHHTDYSKPLDVVWCCFACHRKVFHGQYQDRMSA